MPPDRAADDILMANTPGAVASGDVWTGPDWAKLAPFDVTVPSLVAACTRSYDDDVMLLSEGQSLSFRQADARSAILARRLLAAGYGKGQRIGMILPNGPEFAECWLGITRIGAVAVPISTLATQEELRRILESADLALLIMVDRFQNHDYVERIESALGLRGFTPPLALDGAPFLREIWLAGSTKRPWSRSYEATDPQLAPLPLLESAEAKVTPSDPVTIIFTSGSTAAPKGVIHSHGSLLRSARKVGAHLPYRRGTRQICGSPMFWVGGLVAEWLAAMAVGATTIFTTARGGAMLDLIESERVNYVFIWPHIANQLAAHPSFSERDFSAVQGGSLVAAIPEPLRIRNPIFAGALGMTETAGPHTAYIADMPDRMIGSFGPSSPGMEHRIVHPESRAILPDGVEGELEVRGNTLMLGYVGKERSETFTPDGWFATGDRCRIVEGFVHFSGRVDDMIKCAGANVWPHEVETALRALPGVAAVHVTGVRDVARVSSVGAAIVLEEGATLTESAIRTHAKQALSAFKVPRVIWICRPADLPLTGTNKIDRRRLTELLNWRFGKAKH